MNKTNENLQRIRAFSRDNEGRMAFDDWDESKHPRRPDGKFGSGGGAQKAAPETTPKSNAPKKEDGPREGEEYTDYLERKVDSGNFSDEQKRTLKYAVSTRASGIMEKDGKWVSAKNWNEIDYACDLGWRFVGHPADVIEGIKH